MKYFGFGKKKNLKDDGDSRDSTISRPSEISEPVSSLPPPPRGPMVPPSGIIFY